MSTPPTTVKDLAEALGSGGQRGVTARRCPTCKTPVLVGLDADLVGFPAWVDWTPLTAHAEALALLTGRDTYLLRRKGSGHTLTRRTRWDVRGQTPAGDVVPAHVCHQPLTGTPSTLLHDPTTAAIDDGPCPY